MKEINSSHIFCDWRVSRRRGSDSVRTDSVPKDISPCISCISFVLLSFALLLWLISLWHSLQCPAPFLVFLPSSSPSAIHQLHNIHIYTYILYMYMYTYARIYYINQQVWLFVTKRSRVHVPSVFCFSFFFTFFIQIKYTNNTRDARLPTQPSLFSVLVDFTETSFYL